VCTGIAKLGPELLLNRTAASGTAAPATPTGPATNTLVYAANEQGHVILDTVVNGASVRMLVDTGASLVTLTREDARAAGIVPGELAYTHRASTANGAVRMAPVTLREIRVGQLSIYDVPAAVLEHLNISLLGTSFLTRCATRCATASSRSVGRRRARVDLLLWSGGRGGHSMQRRPRWAKFSVLGLPLSRADAARTPHELVPDLHLEERPCAGGDEGGGALA
jgi:aspartyl protease family protein